jgi:hypothetical protein
MLSAIAFINRLSFSGSTLEVASSKMMMGASFKMARAMESALKEVRDQPYRCAGKKVKEQKPPVSCTSTPLIWLAKTNFSLEKRAPCSALKSSAHTVGSISYYIFLHYSKKTKSPLFGQHLSKLGRQFPKFFFKNVRKLTWVCIISFFKFTIHNK